MSIRKSLSLLALFIVPSIVTAEYCTVGEEEWISGCNASCTASWGGDNPCSESCSATPPPGYVIMNHRVHVSSQTNGGHSVSRVAADQTFDYKRKVEEAYSYALDIAGKANNDEAEGKIQEDMNTAISEAESFNSSHQMIRLKVRANRHGTKYVDERRGWSRVSVDMLAKCVVPANLEQQLLRRYALQQ